MSNNNKRSVRVPQPNPAAAMRAIERKINGYRTSPSPNPPTFVKLPWNSFTYERVTTATPNVVTVNDILSQLAQVCGLIIAAPSGNADIRIKVQSAQVWATGTTATSVPALSVIFNEMTTGTATQYPRSTQSDRGTTLMPAKAGYTYPNSDRKQILGGADAGQTIVSATVGASTSCTARVQILWNSQGA